LITEEEQAVPDTDKSMFAKVTKHDETLEKHDERLDDHDIKIKVFSEQIRQLQDNYIKLENVVMSESRETRITITETNQKLHELINGLMGYKSGQNQLKNNLTIAKWESISKIVGILAGSGGIIYFIVESVTK
jgi:hypothetical protein